MILGLRLNGDWVGEGAAPSATLWQLHVQESRVTLARFDQAQPQHMTRFDCRLSETPFTFSLGEPCEEFIGIALDTQHLVIAGLDEGKDVIFSRPGLDELSPPAIITITPAQPRFSLTRWAAA